MTTTRLGAIAPAACHLLSPAEVAERLAVSRSMVYKLLRTRELRAVYVGRLPRIEAATLEEYIERQRARCEAGR